jgi:transcriptional regulator with XRE-family HTH domain
MSLAAIHPAVPARALKAWRTVRRLKQGHVAELLGVAQSTVSRWEAGRATPDSDEARGLVTLMATPLDGAAEHALGRLVRGAGTPVHLVCDLTHRLLAASPGRTRDWRRPASDLLGRSLWRYASAEIVAAEAALDDAGWFDDGPQAMRITTGANDSNEVPIRPCSFLWSRLQLADGSFVRVVEGG